MIINRLDDFKNLVARIKIFGDNGATESGPLMRYEFAFDITARNYSHDNPALFHKERSVLEPTFWMVVQELARLQKRSVHGIFHDKAIPALFQFVTVGQYFVHVHLQRYCYSDFCEQSAF